MTREEEIEYQAGNLSDFAIAHGAPWQEFYKGFKEGAEWADKHPVNLWKPASGDDLPEYDREVIVLAQPYPLKGSEFAVSFAHRPNPKGYDGKSILTGKIEHYTPMIYGRGGWNTPNVVLWLDLDIPNLKED